MINAKLQRKIGLGKRNGEWYDIVVWQVNTNVNILTIRNRWCEKMKVNQVS